MVDRFTKSNSYTSMRSLTRPNTRDSEQPVFWHGLVRHAIISSPKSIRTSRLQTHLWTTSMAGVTTSRITSETTSVKTRWVQKICLTNLLARFCSTCLDRLRIGNLVIMKWDTSLRVTRTVLISSILFCLSFIESGSTLVMYQAKFLSPVLYIGCSN